MIRTVLPRVATVDTINYSFLMKPILCFIHVLLMFLSSILMERDEHSRQRWILCSIYIFLKVKPAARHELFFLKTVLAYNANDRAL